MQDITEKQELLKKLIQRVDHLEQIFITEQNGKVVLESSTENSTQINIKGLNSQFIGISNKIFKASQGKSKIQTSFYKDKIIIQSNYQQFNITLIAKYTSNFGLLKQALNEIKKIFTTQNKSLESDEEDDN
ncbi:regulator complex protein lamtor3 [Anaeramoeba flamelloides]|uniref:Regulator complex protein lamtor3 n=1 Tax=Anaeramoeba flamelloides TaxID=1746091 RepID=A0ABQ8XCH3_9EUKA|nr:regulator complex protein lamtor3 [Anaeramoeba flamelloides]